MINNKTTHIVINRLEFLAAVIAGMLMFFLVLITFVDVVGRQFGYPLAFAFEFTQLTVGTMFYVVLPLVTLRREHITVDLIAINPASRVGRVSSLLVNLLCASLVAVAAIELWQQAETLAMFNTVTMFTRWPIAPFVYFMSCMAMFTALVFIALASMDTKHTRPFEKE